MHDGNPNLDGADPQDEHARAEALVEPLPDGRILLCCATTSPIRFSGERIAFLHMPGASLDLLNSGRAPLLFAHQHDFEGLLGAIERAWVADDCLLAVARMGSTARARDALALVQDGVLCNASMGFYCRVDTEPDGTGASRVSWWRPHEVSLVSCPRNWDSRVLNPQIPLRVRRSLAKAAAESAAGTPETWRQWAEASAGPIAAHAGLDPMLFEAALTNAVEGELQRLAARAAHCMLDAAQLISDPGRSAAA